MSDPKSLEEYNTKFNQNQHYSGKGLETAMHLPCPACAEPDFAVCPIIEVEGFLGQGAVCKHCGRGFKALYTRSPGHVSFHVVQTQGPDIPSYLPIIQREAKPDA